MSCFLFILKFSARPSLSGKKLKDYIPIIFPIRPNVIRNIMLSYRHLFFVIPASFSSYRRRPVSSFAHTAQNLCHLASITQVDLRQLDPARPRDDDPKFPSYRAPRNCKISWVIPGGVPERRGGSPHKAFGEVWFPMWRVPPHCPLLYERRGEPRSGGVIVKSLSQPV